MKMKQNKTLKDNLNDKKNVREKERETMKK